MSKLTNGAMRMQKLSNSRLQEICKKGSLSHASAAYELRARKVAVPPIGSYWPNWHDVNEQAVCRSVGRN